MIAAGYATLERRFAGIARDFRALRQSAEAAVAPKRSALTYAAEMGYALDDWQRFVLTAPHRRKVCLVSRQGGKGLVGTLTAITKAIEDPGSKIVILTPTEDQSKRLLSRIKEDYARLATAPRVITDTAKEWRLINGSRALAMPGSETSVRGIDAVDLVITDESAFVPDELHAAVRPMLATTNGEELDLSTANGKRGFFYRAYLRATTPPIPGHMLAVRVTADQIPRITPEFLANEREEMGQFLYDQEYNVMFLDDVTQLFATEHIHAALVDGPGPLPLPMFADAFPPVEGAARCGNRPRRRPSPRASTSSASTWGRPTTGPPGRSPSGRNAGATRPPTTSATSTASAT
jgi:hypothetical protein